MRTYTRTSNWCRAMFPRFFPCVIFPIPTPHHPLPKWTLLFLSHSYQYDCSHNLLYIIESNVQASNSLTQLNPPTAPLFSRCMHISPLRSPPVQKLKHPDMILFPTFGTNFFLSSPLQTEHPCTWGNSRWRGRRWRRHKGAGCTSDQPGRENWWIA